MRKKPFQHGGWLRFDRTRRPLAAALSVVVAATLLTVDQQPAAARPAGDRPQTQANGKPAPARPAPKGITNLPDKAKTLAGKTRPTYTWPAAATTEVTVAGAAVAAGGMSVRAAKATGTAPARVKVQTFAKSVSDKAKIDGPVMRLSPATGATAGKVKMSFDYGDFAGGSSGDLGGRLKLVALPECALTTPEAANCAPQPLATVNDNSARTLTAEVSVASATTLVAMQSSEGSAKGNYSATSLAPSSTWSVAASSGSFSWGYPLRVPPVPGGFGPGINFGYNSQAVDGRTSATNNQGSWIGEGFGYEPGFVERRYKPCADDGHKEIGDLCWAYDNATLSLNGSSAELVRSGDTWKLANDDGSKIERLTGAVNGDANDGTSAGEHWKLTSTDGTQYFFGLNRLPGWTTGKDETNSTWTVPVYGDDATNNDDKLPGASTAPKEPCYNATLANAWCMQAWRWNLDYAVDRHGNVMTYYYGKESNYYSRFRKSDVNGTAYDRGGWLKRIEYGLRDTSLYTVAAPARVLFQEAERCDPTVNATACAAGNLTDTTKDAWPDVPFDQICAANVKCKTSQVSPTFFTRKKLSTVTTEIRNGATTYTPVERWTLGHLFPDNGDGSRGLWLHTIKQDGLYGGGDPLSSPEVRLDVKQLPNRILQSGDMLGEFVRPRLGTVYTDTGSQIDIEYSTPECTGSTLPKEGESTKRCYPVKWHGAGTEEPVTDWFNKYVVLAVRETDLTDVAPGTQLPPDMVTFYDYIGDAAWRYPDPDGMTEDKYKTWSEWRGYRTVRISKGDDQAIQTRSEHTYLQGMNGDKKPGGGTRSVTVTDSAGVTYTDDKEFVGFQIETKVLDGTSERVDSKSTTAPTKYETASQTRTFGTNKATFVRATTSRGFTALKSGGWRETKTVTTYDPDYGRATQVDDLGDVSTTADDRCTRTWYADNAAKNLRSLVYRGETVLVNCAATPNRATQVLSEGRTYYDGSTTLGAAPTRGLMTKTERLTAHNGTTATYAMVNEGTFDAYGRPLTTKDAKGTVSRMAYYETNGLTTKKEEYSPKIAVGTATPAEFKSTTEYDPAWGLTTVETDWNLKKTQTTYDKLGRVTAFWTPDRDTRGIATTKYSYKLDPGKPVYIITEKPDTNPAKTQYEYQIYDGFMRPRQVQAPGPNGGRLVTDTWYTSTGQVDRVSEPYYAAGTPSGNLLPTENVDTDIQTGYVYDGVGRVTDVISFSAGKEVTRSRTVYEGDRTHSIPPAGGVATTAISDARGQLTELWHYKDAAAGIGSAHDTTRYEYTPAGQLSLVRNNAGTEWKTTYDQLGRKTSTIDPDAGTTRFEYDVMDRLVRTVNARQQTIETEYDDLGRTTGTFEVTATGRTQLTKAVYDTKAKGQLYTSTRFVNGQQYIAATTILDNLYRPTEVKYIVPQDAGANLAGTYTFTTSYNVDGTIQGATFPASKAAAGEAIVYRYDDLKRLTGVTGTNNNYVTDVKYSDENLVTQVQLDGGNRKSWVTLGYETSTNRLQTLMLKRESYVSEQNPTPDRPSSDINQTYQYDAMGNILSITDAPATGERDLQCFTYDYLRRMTDAYSTAGQDCTNKTVGGVAPYHSSYTYDTSGGRLTEKIDGIGGAAGRERTYEYPDATSARPHALQKVVEKDTAGNTKLFSYEYDAIGNTTKRTEAGQNQTLEWDAEGHVSSVTNADGRKTSYLYGADGGRLLRREPNATTLYLPGIELKLNTATQGVTDTRYIALPGGSVAVRTAAGIQFQIADPNGTGQAAIDNTTGALTMRRSTPFGGDRGTQPAAGQWAGEKGFVGGTTDSTTGLVHLGAREYDPQTGRFISVDPILDVTDPQQMNAYGYGNNSPVTFTDPTGLKFCSDDSCGAGADFVDTTGKYHDVEGHNDGCGGCSEKKDDESSDPPAVRKAKTEHEQNKKKVVAVAKALGKILADELGITDAVNCFTKGDIGGCVSTAFTVLSSLIGGAAGKLIARYAFRIERLAKVVNKLWDLGGKLKNLIGDFFKSKKALTQAENAVEAVTNTVDAVSFIDGIVGGESCLHSFAPDTRVLLANGSTKRIKDVKIGDEVVATDPETGETTTKKIVATFTNDDTELTDVEVADERGRISTLNTTRHHPFWSPTDAHWIDAGDLEAGQSLLTQAGATVQVRKTTTYVGARVMHDLTVNDIHTYYVFAGNEPVLVHNCGGGEGDPAAKGGVYTLRDDEGNVVRTGRTNNLARREREHGRAASTTDLRFQTEYRTDSYREQRGLEQVIWMLNGRPTLPGVRRTSPVDAKKKNYNIYMDAAGGFFSRWFPS
ncbi:polymorphic toxin-type HINT domain-containing protein [Actinoplanes regularis]|uniref:polymorphic toxin-type HINT domain-containing protein n=1 Tax=Actinoplanes regularis TaxID=52697 RepID=UPI0024A50D85|nr:polymorphic toxin-type HINT domain-containing protein [Actinoplanes regularis]GLW35249.1 hypothetical protein Areg01_81850 [Actinoplanes regularis]